MRFRTAFLGVLLFQAAGFCDVIENKTGQRLEGVITQEDDKQITIEVDGMDLSLAKTDVRSIKRGPVVKKTKPVPALPAEVTPPPAEPKKETASSRALDLSTLERPVIVFDERKWKLDYQDARANQVIAEFVVNGESVKKWTELVTAQLFIGLRSEPRYYVEYVRSETAKTCPGAKFEIVHQTAIDVTYFWSVKGCSAAPDQSEVARAYLGLDGMHVLHYAMKGSEMSEQNRQKWIECLEASQFVKPQPQDNVSGNKQ